jgi:hypothetical protein
MKEKRSMMQQRTKRKIKDKPRQQEEVIGRKKLA